jgi:hypothetical protein
MPTAFTWGTFLDLRSKGPILITPDTIGIHAAHNVVMEGPAHVASIGQQLCHCVDGNARHAADRPHRRPLNDHIQNLDKNGEGQFVHALIQLGYSIYQAINSIYFPLNRSNIFNRLMSKSGFSPLGPNTPLRTNPIIVPNKTIGPVTSATCASSGSFTFAQTPLGLAPRQIEGTKSMKAHMVGTNHMHPYAHLRAFLFISVSSFSLSFSDSRDELLAFSSSSAFCVSSYCV